MKATNPKASVLLAVASSVWFLLLQPASAFYNPSTGRWLSRDPLRDPVPEAEGGNQYGFLKNSPTRSVDPDGRKVYDLVNNTYYWAIDFQPGDSVCSYWAHISAPTRPWLAPSLLVWSPSGAVAPGPASRLGCAPPFCRRPLRGPLQFGPPARADKTLRSLFRAILRALGWFSSFLTQAPENVQTNRRSSARPAPRLAVGVGFPGALA